jgi:hypothetical protein
LTALKFPATCWSSAAAPPGVAAATAAGRAGAKVVLLERYGFLGGLATTAQVGTICGLYHRDRTAGSDATPVCRRIFQMSSHCVLQIAGGTKPLRVDQGLWVLPYSPPDVARSVADAVVGESGNVKLILHATVAEARAENARMNSVRALAWNEPLDFSPEAVVDCTGEATAAALAGANSENGATDQAPALVFVLENVDPGLAERGLLEVRRELRVARIQDGALPALCERLSLIPGTGANGRLALKLSLLPANPDHALWQQVTDWERESRALLKPLHRFLVENVAAFRNRAIGFGRAATRRPLGPPYSWPHPANGRRCFERAQITARHRPWLLADGALGQKSAPGNALFCRARFLRHSAGLPATSGIGKCFCCRSLSFRRNRRDDFGPRHRHGAGDRLGGGHGGGVASGGPTAGGSGHSHSETNDLNFETAKAQRRGESCSKLFLLKFSSASLRRCGKFNLR